MATELKQLPELGPLFVKAVLNRSHAPTLPDTRLTVTDQVIDTDRLRRYQQLCGFRLGDVLPPTYLHLMSFPLSISLMAGSSFPFPLLGLVHVRNRVEQRRPVRSDEVVTVSAWAENLREHPAGRQVDLVSTASVGDESVWHEVSTYLHREPSSDRTAPAPKVESGPAAPTDPVESGSRPVVRWPAPAGIGRAYAGVSGDRNPIHLSRLSAKAFGFRRAIAHGMWLKARTLAAFEGRLPSAGTFEVAFKTPVFLPSTVQLQSGPPADQWEFTVTGLRSGKPHLAGTITAAGN
jgi:acyl dehydratase